MSANLAQKALQSCYDLHASCFVTHKAGIIHGDLKPANVCVNNNSRLVIIDFEFSLTFDTKTGLTKEPVKVVGTEGYMAPEIVGTRVRASPKVDLYSVGAILKYWIRHLPDIAASDQPVVLGVKQLSERLLATETERFANAQEALSFLGSLVSAN